MGKATTDTIGVGFVLETVTMNSVAFTARI